MPGSTALQGHDQHGVKSSKLWNFLRHIKYQLVLKLAPRKNRVYTQFYRFPNQYRALTERVIPGLDANFAGVGNSPLNIAIFACCSGAEAFSLSYVLQKNFPALRFHIHAFDIVDEVIARARVPIFNREEVYQSPFVSDEFVVETFDSVGDTFRVKHHIAHPITFAVGDMLDKKFLAQLGSFDLVFAQNVLFHLPRPKAREAFANLHALLKPKAALFINGMDSDMRIALTKRFHLQPLDYLVEEIHDDARVDRGSGWASAYWGRQPFSRASREWLRKYCTIYYKEQP